MKRHKELSLRTPEQTSINRVKSFTQENFDLFMNNLGEVLGTDNKYAPERIWNMDESGYSCVPNKIGKVIAVRGMKKVGQLSSAERGQLMSMALAVNAGGYSMPPMFIFPGKNMQAVNMDNKPPGSIGVANDSGYMKQADFVIFMNHFIQKSHSSLENPNLLILDGHTSHLSIEALVLAEQNGVTLLTIPPHCSHKLQPLDISVFKPINTYYAKLCNDWPKNHGMDKILMRHLVGLLARALDCALTPANIKAGFRASGICPFDSTIFTEADFIQAEISGEIQAVVLAEADPRDEDDPRVIVIGGEAPTSEAPTSSTVSRAASLVSILEEVGPLQPKTTPTTGKKRRGPPPSKSTVLTSPENIATLQDKRAKREAAKEQVEKRKADRAEKAAAKAMAPAKKAKTPAKKAKTPAKKAKTPAKKATPAAKQSRATTSRFRSSSEEDEDFCIVCMLNLPRNGANTVPCSKKCGIVVHRPCAKRQVSPFVCEHCYEPDEVSTEDEDEPMDK